MSSKSNVMMTRYPPTRHRATSWKPRSKLRGLEPREVYLAEGSRGTEKSNPVLKTRSCQDEGAMHKMKVPCQDEGAMYKMKVPCQDEGAMHKLKVPCQDEGAHVYCLFAFSGDTVSVFPLA
nr:hypothetical protein BgiMline_030062 [Biomphalaria glabrata]